MHTTRIALATTAILSSLAAAQDLESLPATIVEAERAEDNLSAVSVLSQDSLDLFQAESFSDLTGLVPGFNVVSADSRGYGQVVAMRGSTNTLFFGPPALGLYVDDVPLGDAYSYPSELLDLQELRVYRGPQGPWFGRNGAAGLVEMTTPGATDTPFTKLTAEYGSYNHLGLHLLNSGSLGGDFSYSLQLFHDQRDGFIRNAYLGDNTDDREASGGLLKLYWNPSDDFELMLRFSAEFIDDGSQRLTSLFSPDPYTDFSDFRGQTDLERYQTSLHSRKDLDWGRIETISSYQTWNMDPSTVDLDLSYPAINGGSDARSIITQRQDLISNEIRFTSNDDAPLTWRAGLFQLWTDNVGVASRQLFPGFTEITNFDIEQLNLAAFANTTWQATEQLSLDAGLRIDYYDTEIDRVQRAPFQADQYVIGSQDDVYVSPVAGITYAFHPALEGFFRSGLGIKPAGYSAYVDNPAVAAYDDEQNWSNEIGLNYDCPAYNLRVGVRAFYDQIDDYQVNFSPPLAFRSTDFFILNANEVTSKGVELDAAWAPVDGLTVRGSIGYTDAEFDSFADPFTPGVYYNGNQVPFVPEYTGSLGVRYEFDCGFYVGSSARAFGPTKFDSANTALFSQDATITWDAEIGYVAEHFTVALFGTNLLDANYYTFINPQIAAGAPADPQQFGIRVSTTF
ncbi:TonB-dependent receptor [Haloferula chungangensis]|uniref:TonB-dependent receptor n=1 Tax=Haloferula chungangensis TaxID=1048331 RepID=A0ABW2LAF8_9BACT